VRFLFAETGLQHSSISVPTFVGSTSPVQSG
jgi:hypothetical protein